jgi:integrase
MFSRSLSPEMLFSDAADLYIDLRTLPTKKGRYLSKNAETNYRRYIASLKLFFALMKLCDIKWWHLKAYQVARLEGHEPFIRFRRPQDAKPRMVNGAEIPAKGKTSCPTKPGHVNQELCLLCSVLRRAGAWTAELEENYEELEEGWPEIPPALAPEQQKLWLNVSRMKPRWEIVFLYSVVAFDLTCSPNEMRAFRLGDINLHHGTITVPPEGTKIDPRNRTITLDSADVVWAVKKLLERAQRLGCRDALHYLFPAAHSKVYDPSRPMSNSGLKKLWLEVQVATELPHFTPRDTRHTGITRMAEAGYPIPVIMARAGQLSPRMTRHYTQVSLAAQRRWAAIAKQRKDSAMRVDSNEFIPQADWTYGTYQ